MPTNHRNRDDNSEQEDRINELKHQAELAAGGEMTAWESDTLSYDRDRHLPHWGDEPPPESEPERTV